MVVDHVVNAQSAIVLVENRKHLLAEPAAIAKLHRPTVILGSDFQEGGKSLRIRLPIGRQLHQDRSQKFPEPIRALEKFPDRVSWLFEPHDMRAVTAELERITEPFGGLPPPSVEGRALRKPIKSVVDLDRVELPGIV